MNDREIKFELSKAALTGGMTIEVAKKFYDWVIAASELEVVDKKTQLDETPIEELAYRTRTPGIIIGRCRDNDINTVGDLIRCGGRYFRSFHNVGGCTVKKIDYALEKYYGIVDWYKS